MDQLPLSYYQQKNSWMDSAMFEAWFHEKFVPGVKAFCQKAPILYKGLLLIDNTPSHPATSKLESRDGKVTTIFLPPNPMSVIQPMDQCVLQAIKMNYCKEQVKLIIAQRDASRGTIPNIVKKLTLKDVVYWVSDAKANPQSCRSHGRSCCLDQHLHSSLKKTLATSQSWTP